MSSVFVYRGTAIEALRGKLVFTDMVTGRVFYADPDAAGPQRIQELGIRIDGREVNIAEAVGYPNTYGGGRRADVRLGIDAAGELYILTKGDGWVRKLIPE